MAQCPKCNKPIDHLDVVMSETTMYSYIDGEFYDEERIESDILRWKCPACFQELPSELSEDAAKEFLGIADEIIVTQ